MRDKDREFFENFENYNYQMKRDQSITLDDIRKVKLFLQDLHERKNFEKADHIDKEDEEKYLFYCFELQMLNKIHDIIKDYEFTNGIG